MGNQNESHASNWKPYLSNGMIIRALQADDIEKIREIHEKYYQEEFVFPDFTRDFLGAFVSVDDDKIVAIGGVRNIIESVVITDKGASVRKRHDALFQILDASAWLTGQKGHTELHAFVQNDIWKHILEKVGFHTTKGQALVLEL